MNIGLLTSANPELRQRLDAHGAGTASDTQAEAVAAEPIAEPKPRPTVNVAPATRYPSMRAALDAQVAGDVASGSLSKDDAGAVTATLDAIDNRASALPSVPAQQAARAYLATIPRGTLVDRFG